MTIHQAEMALLTVLLSLLIFSCAGSGTGDEEKGVVMEEDASRQADSVDVNDAMGKTEEVEGEETLLTEAPAESAQPVVSGSAAKPRKISRADEPEKTTKSLRPRAALFDPSLASEKAAEKFQVRFDTSKGPFVIQVNRNWSPRGADRFYNLVKIGYFDDVAFFRVIKGFVVQFGISGDPQITQKWQNATIADDPVTESNQRGFVTFAMGGPNTRTTQLFINLTDNVRLDQMGFSPLGQVVKGMSVIDSLYSGYGEGAPGGRGPSQALIRSNGNKYLKSEFPKLDYANKATLIE